MRRAMILAGLVALLLLAPTAGHAAGSPAPEPEPSPPAEVEGGGRPAVAIVGVERDRRLGRAWLLARLSGDGHLRTVSGQLKAFAPPGEYEGGFVRIPLIPRPPLARLLRRDGRATVTLTIYFDPPHTPGGVIVGRSVTLVRERPEMPTHALH